MSNLDLIKPSHDALTELRLGVSALVYAVSLIPSDDEHYALLRILTDRLDSDAGWVYREVVKLWPAASSDTLSSSDAA